MGETSGCLMLALFAGAFGLSYGWLRVLFQRRLLKSLKRLP
jgi:hypothetical protein